MKYSEEELGVFEYLDDLREEGVTNMYGAVPYIREEFGCDKYKAKAFLLKWMGTFSDRHPLD